MSRQSASRPRRIRRTARRPAARGRCRRGAGPQLLQPILEGRRVLLGQGDQRQQGIGDAPAGRQHDGLARRRVGLDDPRDALHARGIGDARAAELVDFPGLHATDSLFRAPAGPTRPAAPATGWPGGRAHGKIRCLNHETLSSCSAAGKLAGHGRSGLRTARSHPRRRARHPLRRHQAARPAARRAGAARTGGERGVRGRTIGHRGARGLRPRDRAGAAAARDLRSR